MSVLRVRNLGVRSGTLVLADDVSFDLEPGVPMIVLGETGAGKSIVLAALMGSLPPDLSAHGDIEIFGKRSKAADSAARHPYWGSEIALLPQEPWIALDPTMQCLPQVAEGYRAGDKGTLAREALQRLDLLKADRKLPSALSGGMAQRVAFAAARAGGARILLADEPTKGLDASSRHAVVSTLRQAADDGGSLLVVTHDVAVARELGGRAAVMWGGRIVEQGPTEEILHRPCHAYTQELIASAPSSWSARHHPATGEALLTAREVTKAFGNHRVLDKVSIDIHGRERIAVSATSGSGKSTIGNILLGLMTPDSGEVIRKDNNPRWKFQKLYQDPVASFPPRVAIRRSLRDLANLHRVPWSEIESLLAQMSLSDNLLDRLPAQVSGGELQRLAIVRVLILKPLFLFADEPTSRLDPITQREVIDTLLDTTARQGCSLMVVTHDVDLAKNVAPRRIELG